MKVREKNVLEMLAVAIVVFIVFGIVFHIKAVAKEAYFNDSTDAAESEYKSEIRGVLKGIGAANAGITMTKTCEDGISYEYSVAIHLPKYIDLDSREENDLLNSLKGLELDVSGSSVTFSFS